MVVTIPCPSVSDRVQLRGSIHSYNGPPQVRQVESQGTGKVYSRYIVACIRLMIARYLACLQKWIEQLPDRHERRELSGQSARSIVALKGSKFALYIDTLQELCCQSVPAQMYSDGRVNEMLVQLEDSILAKSYPPPIEQPLALFRRLDWSVKAERESTHSITLPIYGLEHTLSLYFRDIPIRLSNITDLNLSGMNLKGNIRGKWTNDRTSSMDIEIRLVVILEHRQQFHTLPPNVGDHFEARKDISNRKSLL
jgi:hypothetical protein